MLSTHLLRGATGCRTLNEKPDALRLAVQKICRSQDERRLSNAAVVSLASRPVVGRAPAPVAPAVAAGPAARAGYLDGSGR